MKLGILISGRGSNMEAILKAIRKQHISIEPAVVISNNPDAKGLKIAQKLGVRTEIILSPEFIRRYKNRILNIHPAILPSFPGLHAQRQALEYGSKISGCTVHFVDDGVDTGPIILQAAVPIREDDTEDTLSKRILTKEHQLYPQAIRMIAEGKIKISGRTTKIRNQAH
jgi:phosphoribosylglycinamide formyltransferase 1